MPYETSALQGEAVVGRRRWWQRIVPRQSWRRWRLWIVRHKNVCIVATYLQTGDADPETETIASMIVSSIWLADDPADPPEIFAERVLHLARRKFPLLDCQRSGDFQLRLGESNVNLFNFYRSYVNAPDSFAEIVLPALTTVVQVQEWGPQQTDPPLDEVRERIMPMLYPETVWRESFPSFVGAPWVGELMVLYVVDESQTYWYIREELLQQWDLSEQALHELALANLDAYFRERSMEFTMVGEEAGPRLLMPNRPDAYNTSRLLSGNFQRKLRELLGAQFAVGVPNRDFFVAVSLDSEQAIQHVRARVSEDYAQMDHPLTDRLLLVSADGVSEFG